jgi:hypothetical protein
MSERPAPDAVIADLQRLVGDLTVRLRDLERLLLRMALP